MKSVRDNITILLIGTAILMLGQGLLVTLLPVRADLEGLSTSWIGGIGGAYYAGFAIGCLIGPILIQNVGHIRVFAGFAALTAAASLIYQLTPSPIVWVLTRGFSGICFAILFMAIESWLNEQSTNETRGSILSIYIIVTNVAVMMGQLMLNLADPTTGTLFIVCAMLICISLAPVALSRISEPSTPPTARLNVKELYKISPVGFIGCFLFGIVDGSFWSLGPVFAQDRGFSIAGITFFMSAFLLGGTILQWPIGWISDRIDRRIMIAGCCIGTIGTGLSLTFLDSHEGTMSFLVACLHGGFMFPLYGLLLAHANDFAPQEKLVETSGGLLLVYGLGAAFGPFVVAPLMDATNAGYLFLSMSIIFSGFAAFVIIRIFIRPITDDIDRGTFVPLTRSSQAIYELETDDEEIEELGT